MKILIADDDERILRLISDYLKYNHFDVACASNGADALELFKKETFNLVILDIMMPIYDGWIVCKEIRKTSAIPVIILTAKDSDLDELFGFEIGADDYLSKPFNMELLLARVKRLLKTHGSRLPSESGLIKVGALEVDVERHVVKIKSEHIELSPKEFDLLVYLIQHKSRVLTRDMLIEQVWGDEFIGETRTVDTHMTRLRNKLKEGAIYIKTVRGYGYKFDEN